MERVALNLRASLNTDTVSHDVKPFGEDANTLQNTGIERDGGVTNIYQETTALTDMETIYAIDDTRISLAPAADDNRLSVLLDGNNIGTVSAWGVEGRARVGGYDDVCLTQAGTFITATYDEGTVRVAEYAIPSNGNEVGAPLHTRSTTFTNIVALSPLFTSMSIVRSSTLQYSDTLEFALRLGEQVIILNESTPNQTVASGIQSTAVLGGSNILCSAVYNNWLVVAGANGRVGSFDGTNWKYYDGSGIGIGPYGTLLGGNQINCMVVYGTNLVVGGAGGRIASFNGSQWLDYNASGTGLWNNATVISTDNVTAMCVWTPGTPTAVGTAVTPILVVGGSAGKIGSWNGASWDLYSTATSGITDNATVIGSVQINSLFPYTTDDTDSTLIVAGASGRIGSIRRGVGTTAATGPAIQHFSNIMNVPHPSWAVDGYYFFQSGPGNEALAITRDMVNWQTVIPPGFSGTSGGVRFLGRLANGRVLFTSGSTGQVVSTLDMVNWSVTQLAPAGTVIRPFSISEYAGDRVFASNAYHAAATAARDWLAVGGSSANGQMWRTADGVTWTAITSLPSVNFATYRSMAIIGDAAILYSATAGTDTYWTADRGDTWTMITNATMGGLANFMGETANAAYFAGMSASIGRSLYKLTSSGLSFVADFGANSLAYVSGNSITTLPNGWSILATNLDYPNTQFITSNDEFQTFNLLSPITSSKTGNRTPIFTHIGYAAWTHSNGSVVYTSDGVNFAVSNIPTFTGQAYTIRVQNVEWRDQSRANFCSPWDTARNQWTIFQDVSGYARLAATTNFIDWYTFSGAAFTTQVHLIIDDPELGISVISTPSQATPPIAVFNGVSWMTPGTVGTIGNFSNASSLYNNFGRWSLPRSLRGSAPHVFRGSTANTFAYTNDGYSWGAGPSSVAITDAYLGFVNGKPIFNNSAAAAILPFVAEKTLYTAALSLPVQLRLKLSSNGTVIGTNAINAISKQDAVLDVYTGNPKAPGAAAAWTDVVQAGGTYVAIAQNASPTKSVAYSLDGFSWQFATLPATSAGLWYGVGARTVQDSWSSAKRFLIGCTNPSTTVGIMYSDDGLTWTQATTPTPGGAWLGFAYGNGRWVGVCGTSGTTNSIAYSDDDGVTWTYTTLPSAPAQGWISVAYGNGKFVALANSNSTTASIAYSSDGITWAFATTTAPGSTWQDINFGDGKFVVVASSTVVGTGIAYSADGISWTFATLPSVPGGGWTRIVYDSYRSKWIATAFATASDTTVAFSTDAIVWRYIRASQATGQWTGTAPGPTTTVLVQTNGTNPGSIGNLTPTQVSRLFIGGVGGRLGSFDGIGWRNYDASGASASLVSSNATVIGTSDITSMLTIGNMPGTVIVAGANGRVASFDGNDWKNYDGTGSGTSPIYANGDVIGNNTIMSMVEYANRLIISGFAGVVGSFNPDGSKALFYRDLNTNALYSNLLAGFNLLSYLYVYRYENGEYLLNLVGNTNKVSFILIDKTLKTVQAIAARYAIPQVSGGKTRHITTSDPVYDASTVKSIGFVGYTDFINYSRAIVYPTISAPGITATPNINTGFGYSDFIYNVSTTVNNFGPQFVGTETALFNIQTGNTPTLLDAYGKLNNRVDVPSVTPVEFRTIWVAGVQSALSAAVVANGIDNMGTLLTNVGEFDDSYTPQVLDDSTILYRYNGEHYIVKLSKSQTAYKRLQVINDNLVKINSISPNSIVDLTTRNLRIGSSDYNGRIQPMSGTVSAAAIPVAAVFTGAYSNSIDVGAKLFYLTSVGSGNIDVIGYKIPYGAPDKYSIDVYVNGVYSYSVFNDASELVDPNKASLPYVQELRNPVPIGSTYGYRTATTKVNTLVLADAYDGYYLGNELVGDYQFFELFGGLYAFDGRWIYLVQFQGNYIGQPTRIANGTGLRYVAQSPTEAYFISDFDNSLYTFSGGREIVKAKRMNQMEPVVQGIFNSHDAALLLTTANNFIWIRDQIVTQNAKPSTGTERLFSTESGIRIIEGSNTYRYSYKPIGTVVPLTWQSAYFGLDKNLKNGTVAYVMTIFNEAKMPIVIDGVIRGFDQDRFDEQRVKFNLAAKDFDSNGYARIRVQPRKQKNLGTSIELSCASKIVIVDAVVEVVPDAAGTVAKTRSK